MKLSTLILIAVALAVAITPFVGCYDRASPKSPAPEPPVYRYRITHYLPSGEAKVYNAVKMYRTNSGISFCTSEIDGRWTDGYVIGGTYLVEEIAP